ncbi:MAG: tail fiber domain-containing protein, partial [Bacteroidota bacterium]|nr:tail fiber domain-containing protein [Bacteroidota bacterium]
LMYFGVRALAPGQDQTEMVVSWSDNSGGVAGPDDFAFRFTAGAASNVISSVLSDENDLDGRHIARFAATGEMGLGNTFGPPTGPYVRPQNLLHMSLDLNKPVFMQITNQNGTGQTLTDGLHVGYSATSAINKEALVNQMENDRLSLYSNNGERIRITHLNALNNGIPFNPGALAANQTRIGISEDPTQPVTRPLSLLHIGYNTVTPTNDGWRPWMDVGMFASKLSDNVFLGLKEERGILGIPGFDKHDAVLNWGDNQSSTIPTNGPDNFRFIFTSTTTSGTSPANGPDGLEGMRLTPTLTTGVFTGVGGAPIVNLYGPTATSDNPTNTLEVNSWGATATPGGSSGLRFTHVQAVNTPTITNPGNGVLSVDLNGDIIYVPSGGNGLGNLCGATITNPLPGDWEIPMADNNYHFTDNGSATAGSNNVGIGTNCGPLNSKLVVVNPFMNIGIDATTSKVNLNNIGIRGTALNASFESYGVYGQAITSGPVFNTGVYGVAANSIQTNYGGKFEANSATSSNMGVQALGTGALSTNYGVNANAQFGTNTFGVMGTAGGASIANYAIYGQVLTSGPPGAGTPTGPNYAGYFNGDVYIAGTYGPSDINLKENIDSITNALGIIAQLNPKTFDYKHTSYPSMHLPQGMQYGLIAQEVEAILPELVSNNIQPEQLDSTGAVITPAVNFKGLEYQQLIPILIKGIKEQQSKIDSLENANDVQDSINASVQNQLDQLAAMINSCCNSSSAMAQNSGNNHAPQMNSTDVELTNSQSIILEQNVPNPFAEQTTINYFLPDNVVKAQMLFYNAEGKLIQSVDLQGTGKGQLNVFASDLSKGIYTYTLVVDGKIMETKKMIRQ